MKLPAIPPSLLLALWALTTPHSTSAAPSTPTPPAPARPEIPWSYKFFSGHLNAVALSTSTDDASLSSGCVTTLGLFAPADSPDCGDFEGGILDGKFVLINLSFYDARFAGSYRYAKNFACRLLAGSLLDCDAGTEAGPSGLDFLWAVGPVGPVSPGGASTMQGRFELKTAGAEARDFVVARDREEPDTLRIYGPLRRETVPTHVLYVRVESPPEGPVPLYERAQQRVWSGSFMGRRPDF
ncbi:MAG: hypothetical protein M1829_000663 [Trizodia sp. TS-e1964]|nr:MAG: hypothetical protein M1829_000663 [Trizodia sp. TS-e1964]